MSEKRFSETEKNCYYTSLVFDNQTQEELGTNKVVKLLNALHQENEQLREELSECKKFRHSVFKRTEKTIEDKKNCAIHKDAKYPCKAYDECLKREGTNKPLPCMVNWMMGRTFKNMIKKEGMMSEKQKNESKESEY